MARETPLFRTPSLENHLLVSTILGVDAALAALNEAGRVDPTASAVKALVADLAERFQITDAPQICEDALTYENQENRQITIHVPIDGDHSLLIYQVRSMPPPGFVGQIRVQPEEARITFDYKIAGGARAWDASLDGDLALLRTYVGSTAGAIAAFNQTLPDVVAAKIKEKLEFNRARREIAEKMRQRGFVEHPINLPE